MNISVVSSCSPVASIPAAEVCSVRNGLGYTGKGQGLAGREEMVPGPAKQAELAAKRPFSGSP
jgi:hypothetical protein